MLIYITTKYTLSILNLRAFKLTRPMGRALSPAKAGEGKDH